MTATKRTSDLMNAASVVAEMPLWFPRLISGPPVFGRRKDKLIIQILELGGMEILQTECGLGFKKEDEVTRVKLSANRLAQLRDQLVKERNALASSLGGLEKGKLVSLEAKSLKPGVLFIKFATQQVDKKRKRPE